MEILNSTMKHALSGAAGRQRRWYRSRWRIALLMLAVLLSLAYAAMYVRAAQQVREGKVPVAAPPPPLPGALQFDIRSEVTGQPYRILVSVPSAAPPPRGYPVMFLVDGNKVFNDAVRATRASNIGEPLMIVGIGYPTEPYWDERRRFFDLVPPNWRDQIKLWLHLPLSRNVGDMRSQYLKFVMTQVKPLAARVSPYDPERTTLYGHSLGGIFAMYVLFHHPEAFHSYVAASPSIWWKRQEILSEESELARQPVPASPRRILVEVGGAEQTRPIDMSKWSSHWRMGARMIQNAQEFTDRYAPGRSSYAVASLHIFPGQTHLSYSPQALDMAARYAVSGANAPDLSVLPPPKIAAPAAGATQRRVAATAAMAAKGPRTSAH
jgi:predicted alpha/beta superfamily hydrolase